jgi:hypothetical protein
MVDRTIDINHMPVGYSPNDFFYQAVDKSMDEKQCNIINTIEINNALIADPTNTKPNLDNIWKQKCSNVVDSKDSNLMSLCYQHELCRNNDYTNILTKTNTNHSGADGRYQDSKTMYNMEYLTLGNLSFGVIKLSIVIGLIYYNK